MHTHKYAFFEVKQNLRTYTHTVRVTYLVHGNLGKKIRFSPSQSIALVSLTFWWLSEEVRILFKKEGLTLEEK